MTKNIHPRRTGAGDILQQSLKEGLANLPIAILEFQIAKKLKVQGVKPSKGLARKIAEHILSGSTEPFVSGTGSLGRPVHLTVDNSDVDQMVRALERFETEQLSALVASMASGIAKRTLKNLKEPIQNVRDSNWMLYMACF